MFLWFLSLVTWGVTNWDMLLLSTLWYLALPLQKHKWQINELWCRSLLYIFKTAWHGHRMESGTKIRRVTNKNSQPGHGPRYFRSLKRREIQKWECLFRNKFIPLSSEAKKADLFFCCLHSKHWSFEEHLISIINRSILSQTSKI